MKSKVKVKSAVYELYRFKIDNNAAIVKRTVDGELYGVFDDKVHFLYGLFDPYMEEVQFLVLSTNNVEKAKIYKGNFFNALIGEKEISHHFKASRKPTNVKFKISLAYDKTSESVDNLDDEFEKLKMSCGHFQKTLLNRFKEGTL